MSPRRTRRPKVAGGISGRSVGPEQVEEWPEGAFEVRPVSGGADRSYLCPGCGQRFAGDLAHLVVWPAEGVLAGPAHRRHWHAACWRSHDRRRPVG